MTKRSPAIDINFASADYRLSSRVFWGVLAVIAALLVVTAVMARTVLSYHAEKTALDRKLAELTARDEQLQPVLAERENLLRDLSAMSGIVEARRFSWTQLLTDIERIFPEGVALDHMGYNPKDRALVLEGGAQSPEALRNLMVGLEKSALFKNPFLKHQSVDKGVISFTVGAFYRENTVVDAARAPLGAQAK